MMPKWYFDAEFDNGNGRCLKFVYSGCNGNRNNFETQRDCEHTCLRSERDYLYPPKDEIVEPIIDVITRPPPVITGKIYYKQLGLDLSFLYQNCFDFIDGAVSASSL